MAPCCAIKPCMTCRFDAKKAKKSMGGFLKNKLVLLRHAVSQASGGIRPLSVGNSVPSAVYDKCNAPAGLSTRAGLSEQRKQNTTQTVENPVQNPREKLWDIFRLSAYDLARAGQAAAAPLNESAIDAHVGVISQILLAEHQKARSFDRVTPASNASYC